MTFLLLLCLLAALALVVTHWLRRFPNPSVLVAPLLPPKKRQPQPQLWERVEEGSPDPGFIRFFMRDPERAPPARTAVVAPVDGAVLLNARRDGRFYMIEPAVYRTDYQHEIAVLSGVPFPAKVVAPLHGLATVPEGSYSRLRYWVG